MKPTIHDDDVTTIEPKETELLVTDAQPDLPYAKVTSISFWFWLKEIVFFSINYVMDRITFILTFVFFRLGGFIQDMAILGLVVLAIDLFFCFCRDFQEAVGIVLGPYYSKGDSKNYYFFLTILIFWNFVFFLICLPFVFFQRQFFVFFGIDSDMLDKTVWATQLYMLTACGLLSISNFMKGNHSL